MYSDKPLTTPKDSAGRSVPRKVPEGSEHPMTNTKSSPAQPADQSKPDPRLVIWDFVERAGWSAGQQLVSVLLAAGTAGAVLELPWALAAAMAGGAAVASVVTTAIQYLSKLTNLSFWPDLLIRLTKTFLASLAGSFGADAFNVLIFNWSEALGIAVLATLGALGKGMLARQEGPGNTPSTLSPAMYPAPTG